MAMGGPGPENQMAHVQWSEGMQAAREPDPGLVEREVQLREAGLKSSRSLVPPIVWAVVIVAVFFVVAALRS